MNTVWKYELMLADTFVLTMPQGAIPLAVQTQDGIPTLWALVDPNQPMASVRFRLAGTGHMIATGPGIHQRYIGTFQLHDGKLVFHLFEDRSGD